MNEFNIEETVCNCPTCIEMCRRFPCWGTPEDIKKIVEAGFADCLSLDCVPSSEYSGVSVFILYPAITGFEGRKAEFAHRGVCTFLTKDNKCRLHTLGLKPTEGRVMDHKCLHPEIHEKVLMSWNNAEAQEFAKSLFSNLLKGDSNDSPL